MFCSVSQRIHNLTIPSWATQEVFNTLEEIASFEVMYSVLTHKRKDKARLAGGEYSSCSTGVQHSEVAASGESQSVKCIQNVSKEYNDIINSCATCDIKLVTNLYEINCK